MITSTRTTIKTSSEPAFHETLLTLDWAGRIWWKREFPFPKLRSRWLLIIFHANLHLELRLLVEGSMTSAAGELSLQEQFLAQEDD